MTVSGCGQVHRVSVIIPCKNLGSLVRHAVRSAVTQADDDDSLEVEVIVVDDHSDDPATQEVLAEVNTWD